MGVGVRFVLKAKIKNLTSFTDEIFYGASEENRTPTPVKVLDFESSASTSSATEATVYKIFEQRNLLKFQSEVKELK
jgi:hypothetical protein